MEVPVGEVVEIVVVVVAGSTAGAVPGAVLPDCSGAVDTPFFCWPWCVCESDGTCIQRPIAGFLHTRDQHPNGHH